MRVTERLSRRGVLRRLGLGAAFLAASPLLVACQLVLDEAPPLTPPAGAIRELLRATPTPAPTPVPTETPVRQASVKVTFLAGTLGGMQRLYDGVFHAYQDANPDVAVIGTYLGATVPEI